MLKEGSEGQIDVKKLSFCWNLSLVLVLYSLLKTTKYEPQIKTKQESHEDEYFSFLIMSIATVYQYLEYFTWHFWSFQNE